MIYDPLPVPNEKTKARKVQFFQQSKGQNIAILMVGEKKELEETFCSFFNWGGCSNSELIETGKKDSFYLWSTRKVLLNYYQNISEHKFYLKYGYEPGERGQTYIKELARKKLKSIPYMNFLPRSDGRIYY